jgi:hypothetical protein
LKFDREIVNDDRVGFEIVEAIKPHPLSDYGPGSFGFQTISRSVRQVMGGSDEVIVLPGEFSMDALRFIAPYHLI